MQALPVELLGRVVVRARNSTTGRTLGSLEIPFYIFVVDSDTSAWISRVNRAQLRKKGLPTTAEDQDGCVALGSRVGSRGAGALGRLTAKQQNKLRQQQRSQQAAEERAAQLEDKEYEEWRLGGAAQASPNALKRRRQRMALLRQRAVDKRVRRRNHTWKIRGADARAQVMADVSLVTKKKRLRGIDFRNREVVDMLHKTLRKARVEEMLAKPPTLEELAELDDGYGPAPQVPVRDRVKLLGDRGNFGGANDR